jgi:hypothetical protein
MPRKPKSSHAPQEIVRARLLEVQARLARLQPAREIRWELSKEWGVEETTVHDYIQRARVLARSSYEEEAHESAIHLREAMIDLHNIAYKHGDYRTCATVLAQLAKLMGVNREGTVDKSGAAVAVNVNATIGPGAPNETRKRIGELLGDPLWHERLKNPLDKPPGS